MINLLQKIAQAIAFLRLPCVAIGLFALATAAAIVFNSNLNADELFLIPSVIALLWAMSCYFFIVTFNSVPENPDKALKFTARLKQNTKRAWYWFIGLVFILTTLAAASVTYRILSIWLKDYNH
jgi:energy-coupling factor transporter transmembrane protein EcfT